MAIWTGADWDVNSPNIKAIWQPGKVGTQSEFAEYTRYHNPYFLTKIWTRGHYKNDTYGYLSANFKIDNHLNVTLKNQIDTYNLLRTEYLPYSAHPYGREGNQGDYREDRRNLFENNTDLIANYNKRIGKFNIAAFAGASERAFNYNSLYATTKAMSIPNVYVLTNSTLPYSSFTWDSKMQVYSGFYSFDLTYDKYLTLSNTGRVDNLSTLPKGNNTFFYPSVSLSTVISDYVQLPKAISFLKLRGSFAQVKGGLTAATAASAFTQITKTSTNGGLLGYGSDLYSSYDGPTYDNQNNYSLASYYNSNPSVDYSNTIANPNLKPFNVTSYEGGVDVKFLKNRIGVDMTYFSSQNGPQIFRLPIAGSSSYNYQNVNAVTTQKKGFELAITGSPIKSAKGLNWDVAINYATFKETLKDIYNDETQIGLNNHNYKKGERIDAIYGVGFVRDASNNIVYSGGLPLRAPSDIDNNTLLGYANPDFTFGINNRFTYHNFSFSFQFDGRIGGKIFDEVYKDGMNGGTAIESASGAFGTARLAEWQTTNLGTVAPTGKYIANGVKLVSGTPIYKNGQITNFKDLIFAPNDVPVTVQNFISSGIGNITEYWMTDRSFAKLREVTLGYTLPARVLAKNKFIRSATFSLVGRNLLYFAKRKDIDLDQFASGYSDSDKSLNNGGQLQSTTARRFGFNINLGF